MKKPVSIYLLFPQKFDAIYNQAAQHEIGRLTHNDGRIHTREMIQENPAAYQEVEMVFSGWGAPVFDEQLLAALPALKAIFYGAGTVKSWTTDALWDRDIMVTSAFEANAIPVAEYTVAAMVLGLKKAWTYSRNLANGIQRDRAKDYAIGVFDGSRVGIISLGAVGRRVCQMLQDYNIEIAAYDPFVADSLFEELGIQRMDSLDQLFRSSDVVSLHAPSLPSTEGLITKEHFQAMMAGATFINTARGAIVDETGMIEVLRERPDIFAVLDVITDEGRYHSSELARMDNVFLTPHIAGSLGRECHRMGLTAVEECRRYLAGETPIAQVTRSSIALMA